MDDQRVDLLLVGSGIMSATLATLLMQLDPTLSIAMIERLSGVAQESTDGWNNAGTGHAGYCELNYTPQSANGDIQTQRALEINAAFEVSLQLWAYLVNQQVLPNPRLFISPAPHISFVWGQENVAFLRKRYQLLTQHPLFAEMEYSEDRHTLAEWMPLIMQGRDPQQSIAATRIRHGADIDFGALTRCMVDSLKSNPRFQLYLNHSVQNLKQQPSKQWCVGMLDLGNKQKLRITADRVFLGAGGAALPLLQKSGIPEGKQYGGFPVSGLWLVCNNQAIINQHHAKVYGQAAIGAPPMSVPHLDARVVDGKSALLFGPYAGFTTKFLKTGSWLDWIKSIRTSNLNAIWSASKHHMDLTRYLVTEVFKSHGSRLKSLKEFYPQANLNDWVIAKAGQRVQIIKQCDIKGGKLEFGTEIVSAQDGTLAALLGASPGASVSVTAMLDVIERFFAARMQSAEWQEKLREMIPSYGRSLVAEPDVIAEIRAYTVRVLKLYS